MRLINVNTMKLESFHESEKPPYVCLSHRWTDQELSYEDFSSGKNSNKAGRKKIQNFCKAVRANDISILFPKPYHRSNPTHAWVDTVCIDKRSSSELSEAINSMGKWYAECAYCVAYLADVSRMSRLQSAVEASEWFRRGWTLQELLFPEDLIFLDHEWEIIDDKRSEPFASWISAASRIPKPYLLDNQRWKKCSIAQKMSWASGRQATRIEDEAYCLLGLFRINMPLLYGEGFGAFHRLQHEIIRQSDDESIFAWGRRDSRSLSISPLFTDRTQDFQDCDEIERVAICNRQPYTLTNRGLQFRAPAVRVSHLLSEDIFLQGTDEVWVVELNCTRPVIPSAGTSICSKQVCLLILVEHRPGIFLRIVASDRTEQELIGIISRHGLSTEESSEHPIRVFQDHLFYIQEKYATGVWQPSIQEGTSSSILTLERMLGVRDSI